MRRRTGARVARDGRDRGAVFVEFALAVPLLVLLAMGVVEFGIGWKAANDVNAAARDGARTGTSATAYLTADRDILLAVGSALTAEQRDNIEKVIVYKASGSDGKVPNNCKSLTNTSGNSSSPGSRVGRSESCNVYGKGQIEYALANPANTSSWVTMSGGTASCGSNVASNWCPATRTHSLATGNLDYLGVYIEMKHEAIANYGFGDRMIERSAVFRLEPSFGGD